MANEAIDKKLLAGLKFRSSEKSENGEGFTPTKRALTPADVLDWKDNGTSVTIVTADGQKYNVSKTAKVKDESKDESKE